MGIFKNPTYIKKNQSRYKLKNSNSFNDVENYSLEDIDDLNTNIIDLFKKSPLKASKNIFLIFFIKYFFA